jgi:predicted Zn-dependent protease
MAKRQAAGRVGRKTTTTRKATPKKRKKKAAAETPAAAEPVRAAFRDAVDLYDQALRAIQVHEYATAATLLRELLSTYPAEFSLHDRVRLYLQICDRHLRSASPAPKTVDDHLYAATVAMNTGDRAAALKHLAEARRQEPENDHALYMLGVIRSLNGELEVGLEYLRKAIEANPDNRALVRHEPELEALRATEGFKLLLDSMGSAKRRPRARRSR